MIPIRVLIADDHTIVREGLSQMLDPHPDLDVIGEAKNGLEALEMTRKLRPDVLLLDIGMPQMNGLEAVKLIREAVPSTEIVILSMYEKEAYAHHVLNAGARAYVVKAAPSADVLKAIHAVYNGKYYMSSQVHSEVIETYVKNRPIKVPCQCFDSLSDREKQVFFLLVEGKTTSQIGEILYVSPKTIEKHRAGITKKLGLSKPIEMAKYAMRIGILDPDHWQT